MEIPKSENFAFEVLSKMNVTFDLWPFKLIIALLVTMPSNSDVYTFFTYGINHYVWASRDLVSLTSELYMSKNLYTPNLYFLWFAILM